MIQLSSESCGFGWPAVAPLSGTRVILPAVSISTRHTVIPALSAAWIARFTSDLRNVEAAFDITLTFRFVTLVPNFDSYTLP